MKFTQSIIFQCYKQGHPFLALTPAPFKHRPPKNGFEHLIFLIGSSGRLENGRSGVGPRTRCILIKSIWKQWIYLHKSISKLGNRQCCGTNQNSLLTWCFDDKEENDSYYGAFLITVLRTSVTCIVFTNSKNVRSRQKAICYKNLQQRVLKMIPRVFRRKCF